MIRTNFKSYGSYLTDTVYQWDQNRELLISGLNLETAPEVQFSNANTDRAIPKQATLASNHDIRVGIPNSLLQDPLPIIADIGVYEGDEFKVIERVSIPVIPKARPIDYVLEDTDRELYSFKRLENMINNIDDKWSDFTTATVDLAVNAWLVSHPEATTTVQDGALTESKFSEELKLHTIKDYATPQMYGAKGDAVEPETQYIKTALSDNNLPLDLCDGYYMIDETIELSKTIKNGTIIWIGDDIPVFDLKDGGKLENIKIRFEGGGYASSVIRADYTPYEAQFKPMSWGIENVEINNSVTTEFVEGSACLHIIYDKYKVIVDQNINGLRLKGRMDYGIYIEPKLRNESDNPVFNTSVFSNVWFNSVNCALYVCPTMETGELANAQGGVKLVLMNFANQHTDDIVKPFIDIHNTEIEGYGVIPWDYYGDNIPADGTYKTHNSIIVLDMYHFGENTNDNVYYKYRKVMTNETYSFLPPIRMSELDADFNPLRSTGINGAMERVRFISTTPNDDKYNVKHYGVMFQSNNKNDPAGNFITQLLIRATNTRATMWLRKFFPDTGTWGDRQQIYGDGSVPNSNSGNRPDGLGIGDMRYDTTLKKPIWWNGEAWVLADGTAI